MIVRYAKMTVGSSHSTASLLAFPHLTAKEQLATLLSQPQDDDILLELTDLVKPLDEETFETHLQRACDNKDECAQFLILIFGGSADTRISEGARKHLGNLVRSDSERVRAQALRLIARCGDNHLIAKVLQSGWNGAQVQTDASYEAWYGSVVILEASARNMIPYDQALERIAPQLYGQAAKVLKADAGKYIAEHIGASILRAINLTIDDVIPDIEITVPGEDRNGPTMYDASEKPSNSDDPLETCKRFSESEKDFEERQTRVRKAFEAFKDKLTQANAQIILDALRIDEFDAIASVDWKLTDRWYELLVNLPATKLSRVYNLGYLLAHALCARCPGQSGAFIHPAGR